MERIVENNNKPNVMANIPLIFHLHLSKLASFINCSSRLRQLSKPKY
jgi:hypothetical protein